jgi:probable rRNA maturation factor
MILLDPELDSTIRPPSKAASPSAVWRRSALPWSERLPTPRTLARFLSEAQDAIPLRGQVTVLLTIDAAVCDLNRRFRRKNKPTDVLSFPATTLLQSQERIAGDLAISVDTARRQAAEQGHALTCELKILILHGLLHLAGYDHETDQGKMHRRERSLRQQFGLPQGLIERTSKNTRPKPRSTVGCPILSRPLRKGGKTRTSARKARSRTL